jgi:hypothetical protein
MNETPKQSKIGIVVAGVSALALGGFAWLLTGTAAQSCSSAFVSALDPRQCSTDTTIHSAGAVGALVGVVLIVVAIVRR